MRLASLSSRINNLTLISLFCLLSTGFCYVGTLRKIMSSLDWRRKFYSDLISLDHRCQDYHASEPSGERQTVSNHKKCNASNSINSFFTNNALISSTSFFSLISDKEVLPRGSVPNLTCVVGTCDCVTELFPAGAATKLSTFESAIISLFLSWICLFKNSYCCFFFTTHN